MNNFKGDYLEDAAQKYGVFISDLKYTELRTQVLLELTVEAEKYSREALTEAVSYLEGKNVKFKDLKEMKIRFFDFSELVRTTWWLERWIVATWSKMRKTENILFCVNREHIRLERQ